MRTTLRSPMTASKAMGWALVSLELEEVAGFSPDLADTLLVEGEWSNPAEPPANRSSDSSKQRLTRRMTGSRERKGERTENAFDFPTNVHERVGGHKE